MKALSPPRLWCIVVAGFAVLPSCRESSQARAEATWWRHEAERTELQHKVQLLELRQSRQDAAEAAFKEVKRTSDLLVHRVSVLSQRGEELRGELQEAQQAAESAKTAWIRNARDASVGKKFAEFSGAGDRLFRDVEITGVTDAGVRLRHADGVARLTAAQLTREQQMAFGLDMEMSGAAVERERESAIAYSRWVDEKVAVQQEAQERTQRERVLAASRATPAPRVNSGALLASLDRQPRNRLQESPRSFGRGNSHWYGYTNVYRRYSRYGCYSRYSPRAGYIAAGRPMIYDPDGSTYRYYQRRATTSGYTPTSSWPRRAAAPSTGTPNPFSSTP